MPRATLRCLLLIVLPLVLVTAACGDDATTATTAAGVGSSSTTMAMGDMEGMNHTHDGGHEVTWSPPPSVSLSATEVGPGSYDLDIKVDNFTIVGENTPPEPVDKEGHLHLYVDGRVASMVYSDTSHVDGLAPGDHELRVELSAADHQPWLLDGEPIDATTTVTVAGDVAEPDDVIDVTVDGDDVTGGGRHPVSVGDLVTIRVTADVDDQLHVHGYDIMQDVTAGEPAEVTFTADIPGQFVVELEHAGIEVVQLVVS